MALTKIDDRGLKTPIDLLDNEKIRFGTGNDLEIYHTGSDSRIIHTTTGDFKIRGNSLKLETTDGQEYVRCTYDTDVKLFYDNVVKFQTTSDGYRCDDNVKGTFGSSADLKIYHDGTDNYWETSATTHFRVSNGNRLTINGGSGDVSMQGASGRNFLWDNSAAYLNLNDNAKATYGTDNDLQIYHDGSSSFIYDDGTGPLNIQTNNSNINIKGGGSAAHNMAIFKSTEGVELYYNNYKTFSTRNNGIEVTGPDTDAAIIGLNADNGDDDADKWQIVAAADGVFVIKNKSTGSYVDSFKLDGSNNAVIAGNLLVNNRLQLTGPSIYDKSGTGNSIGIQLSSAGVLPTDGSGAESNNTKDLGSSSHRWKDIYAAGNVYDSKGDLRNIPQNAQTGSGGNYVCVASDAGKHILRSGNGVNFPSNVFAAGDAITVINNSASDMNMVPGSGVTLYNTADGQTGQRVLAARGMCTVIYASSGANVDAYISGAGLS